MLAKLNLKPKAILLSAAAGATLLTAGFYFLQKCKSSKANSEDREVIPKDTKVLS